MRRNVLVGAIALIAAIIVAIVLIACCGHTAVTAARFSALRADNTALRSFLGRMPKGADLHVHLSGAVFAEDLIAWAAKADLCIRLSDLTVVVPPCVPGQSPPIADAPKQQPLYDRIVNAMSMRAYTPSPAAPSGHDQFFVTFGRYGEITWRIPAQMTAERLRHYGSDSVQHTELMISFFTGDQRRPLVAAMKDEKDFAARLALLKENGLDRVVTEAKAQVDKTIAGVDAELACDAEKTKPGCNVSYRYIAQISRTSEEKDVFVQTALAAALIRADKRVAGLNFVGPEDYRVAREDYRSHMAMIGFLAKDVPVALHAGELWIGLVPPEDLTFHIRDAVETAGARRIGHGVALAFEKRTNELLEAMRKKPVAVEINLTSNDVILGVRGNDHPLMAYRAARVPVVLSTDDAGVSRIDLTNEYVRAARDYPLGYRELRKMARNSLDYAFLDAADKDEQIKRLEAASAEFERSVASERGLLRNIGTLIAGLFRWP